jgi:hypothetical protein
MMTKGEREPSEETLQAIEELEFDRGDTFKTVDDLFEDLEG